MSMFLENPSTSGRPRTSMESAKTSSEELRTAGRRRGTLIESTARTGDAPVVRAASSNDGSMPSIALRQKR
ncbi:hypothetical protein LUX39_07375 [Actinomadura madurae]|nr:hypothetical protein [Actinomadura madurae]MCQ0013634.1 hypothetical protein [Actinomadura madurae]